MRGRTILLCCLPALIARTAGAQAPLPRPADATRTGTFQDPKLRESSGVTRSRKVPGLLFTLNDSGNDPIVFATDSSGRAIGRWHVTGAANTDWEAISVGPCPAGSCLYLADIGDNLERRSSVRIYRVPEPESAAIFQDRARAVQVALDSLIFRYPDGAHDAEAIWIDEASRVNVVTKGRTGGIRRYRLTWPDSAGGVRTAEFVQALPIEASQRLGSWVTDAARSPDGRRVAVRTYTMLYLFPVLPDGRLGLPGACGIAGLEPQGEGVEWLDDRRLILTSEAAAGDPGPLHIVRCDA